MVIFFVENDLVSFGEYMISEERTNLYKNNPAIKEDLEQLLSQVNNIDLENWMRINSAPKQEPPKPNMKLVN
jgi:hypothetical protein